MKSRIAALLFIAVVSAIGIGAWLGGWGDKLPGRIAPSQADVSLPQVSSPPQESAPAVVTVPSQPAPVAPPQPMTRPIAAAPPASVKLGGPVAPPELPAAKPDLDLVAKATQDIDKISLMLRDFRTLMGTNPVGPNSEIMSAVIGGNPKQARLGPPEGQQLNGKGELIDAWGTPYFFHQMSGTQMEINSAGPDKTFGTPDDIIGR